MAGPRDDVDGVAQGMTGVVNGFLAMGERAEEVLKEPALKLAQAQDGASKDINETIHEPPGPENMTHDTYLSLATNQADIETRLGALGDVATAIGEATDSAGRKLRTAAGQGWPS